MKDLKREIGPGEIPSGKVIKDLNPGETIYPFENFSQMSENTPTDPPFKGANSKDADYRTPQLGTWGITLACISDESDFAQWLNDPKATVLVVLPGEGEKIVPADEVAQIEKQVGTKLARLLIGTDEEIWEEKLCPFLFTVGLPSGAQVQTSLKNMTNGNWIYKGKSVSQVALSYTGFAGQIAIEVERL